MPEATAKALSIYPLFGIGFKGGAAVAANRLDGLLEAAFKVVEKHIGVVTITDVKVLRAERF